MNRIFFAALASVLLTACAGRADYEVAYLAQQGDYDAALDAARSAQNGGIGGMLFGIDAGACRDYGIVVAVLVAKSDFEGAQAACAHYDKSCAVVPDNDLCFYYRESELRAASTDAGIAQSLSEDARNTLNFRWLMIRDDYEGNPLKRPIY